MGSSSGKGNAAFPGWQASESPVPRLTRHSSRNQEYMEELRVKADELERLFTEQKLQTFDGKFSSRRTGAGTGGHAIPPRVHEKQIMTGLMRSSRGGTKFGTSPSVKMVGDQEDCAGSYRQDASINGRGQFYDEYMRRRNAKLRLEGEYQRALKEAKLRDMQANLEMNISELKAKFSGSVEGSDSNFGVRARIQKLRSFNIRSRTRMDEYTRALFCDEAENYSHGQSKVSPGDGSSRGPATEKHFSPFQVQPSSKPQTTRVPVPRPPNSNSQRRRPQSEGPLLRSLPVLPNFSNTKKEKKNPAPGLGQTEPRSQDRGFTRSKRTGEDEKGYGAKEKKTRDSQATRKSSSRPSESKNLSAWNSDGAILESVRFDQEWVRPSLNEKLVKRVDLEAFPTNSKNSKCNDDFGTPALEAVDMANQTEDEEIKNEEVRYHATLDDGNSGSPNNDSIGSQNSDLMSVSMLPRYCQRQLTEIDASVDSSVGSSISWSSQLIVHAEMGLARTRKKWGNAHAGDLSQNVSSKDAKKGFWLLKFGRSQVAESSVNRVSTLTSDGDNAFEGRCGPPPKRSLEHLRQPVTGFLQDHSCSVSFSASDLVLEQVQAQHRPITAPAEKVKLRDDKKPFSGSSLKAPRSFFSLSSFRSKGRDLKVYN